MIRCSYLARSVFPVDRSLGSESLSSHQTMQDFLEFSPRECTKMKYRDGSVQFPRGKTVSAVASINRCSTPARANTPLANVNLKNNKQPCQPDRLHSGRNIFENKSGIPITSYKEHMIDGRESPNARAMGNDANSYRFNS